MFTEIKLKYTSSSSQGQRCHGESNLFLFSYLKNNFMALTEEALFSRLCHNQSCLPEITHRIVMWESFIIIRQEEISASHITAHIWHQQVAVIILVLLVACTEYTQGGRYTIALLFRGVLHLPAIKYWAGSSLGINGVSITLQADRLFCKWSCSCSLLILMIDKFILAKTSMAALPEI